MTVITHRTLFAIVLSFGLANAMLRPMSEQIKEFGFYAALWQGFGISFIVWFAIHSIYEQLYRVTSSRADLISLLVGGVTLLFFMLPSSMVAWVALGLYCCYYAFFVPELKRPKQRVFRSASLIALALAFRVPLSDTLLKISADFLLRFDAFATEKLLAFSGFTASRTGNIVRVDGEHDLLVMTGCASFTNISLALLLWFTLVRAQGPAWKNSNYLVLGLLAVLVLMMNLVRLSLMTLSRENYFFYHEGTGADIIDALIVFVAIALAFVCILPPKETKREDPRHAH